MCKNTPAKGNPYYLFNVYGALDSENEWWYDEEEQMLYLYGDPTGKPCRSRRAIPPSILTMFPM